MKKEKALHTKIAQIGVGFDHRFGAISVPIYQTAIYKKKFGENLGYDYSRSENPTRTALESAIAELEEGARGLAFSSGMAAITSLSFLFEPGDLVIVSDDLYGGTYRLFQEIMMKYGITFYYMDLSNVEGVEEFMKGKRVRAIFIETPTNPLMKIADIRRLVALAKTQDAITIVDSTLTTPLLMKPLQLGADVVVHSATKYLGGHNDLIGGLIVAADAELGERLYFKQKAAGAIMGPFDCWLLIRGMKTLAVRLAKAQENADAIALHLYRSGGVKKVYFPGLPGHPGNDVHFSQAEGPGAVLSFELDEGSILPRFFDSLKVVSPAESLGGVESLTTHPATMTHADIPEGERLRIGITDNLVRISVGIEDLSDLIPDIDNAIRACFG